MVQPIHYTTFDEHGMKEVRCMKGCGTVIADRREKDGKLRHMSHSRNYPVTLEDGSYSNMLVCAKCYTKISDSDLPEFQEAQRWGWKKEWEHINKKEMPPGVYNKMIHKKNLIKRGYPI